MLACVAGCMIFYVVPHFGYIMELPAYQALKGKLMITSKALPINHCLCKKICDVAFCFPKPAKRYAAMHGIGAKSVTEKILRYVTNRPQCLKASISWGVLLFHSLLLASTPCICKNHSSLTIALQLLLYLLQWGYMQLKLILTCPCFLKSADYCLFSIWIIEGELSGIGASIQHAQVLAIAEISLPMFIDQGCSAFNVLHAPIVDVIGIPVLPFAFNDDQKLLVMLQASRQIWNLNGSYDVCPAEGTSYVRPTL